MSSAASNTTLAKAIRIHEVGDPSKLVLDTITLEPPSPSQVQIELYVIGVNYIDTYHRTGLYKLPSYPAVIGREGAGIIRAVGSDVKNLAVGDRVVFLSGAAYATFANVDASVVVKVDSGISLRDAATVHLQGLTAHAFTHDAYPIKSGDVVLIHAAAGGTGALLLQMAKLRGATVIATVGSTEKAEQVKKLGADYVINYNEIKDFASEVRRLTNGVGVAAVFDGVGASTYEGSLKSLKKRGTFVSFGNASGPVPPIPPLDLSNNGSLLFTRPTVTHFIESRSELEARTRDIHSWVKSGQLKLRVAGEFPLEEAKQAHEALESRKFAGKILLTVKKE